MSRTPLLLLSLVCGTCYCSCPDSWTSFGSSCYVFINQPHTWYNAAALCMLLGSRLVEINSPSENVFVLYLLIGRKVDEAWIGINDIVQDGHWVLTSSGRALSFTNWLPGEPNNGGREENGGLMLSNGKWNDYSTSGGMPLVCERSHLEVRD